MRLVTTTSAAALATATTGFATATITAAAAAAALAVAIAAGDVTIGVAEEEVPVRFAQHLDRPPRENQLRRNGGREMSQRQPGARATQRLARRHMYMVVR